MRQEVKDTKVEDDSFYLLTLAAVAKELKRRGLAEAKIFLAVGLPLTRFEFTKTDITKLSVWIRSRRISVSMVSRLKVLSDGLRQSVCLAARMMIACCNDGTRPVIFKIERIDIPENEEEKEWLAKQNFKNTADDAYTG